MQLFSKISVALVATLAAVSEASFFNLFDRDYSDDAVVVTSVVSVYPVPLASGAVSGTGSSPAAVAPIDTAVPSPILTPSVPLTTGAPNVAPESSITSSENITLTYTLGTGTSTTVVTTTICRASSFAVKPVSTPPSMSLTTVSTTSTTTHTVTVLPTNVNNVNAGSPPGAGAGGASCPPAVTVTVTTKETVTVTASPSGAAPAAASSANKAPVAISSPDPVATESNVAPIRTSSSSPSSVSMAPYGNGTEPITPGSSGFLTKTRRPRPTGHGQRHRNGHAKHTNARHL